MWWKNTRIMALSAVVGVVSGKPSYLYARVLIEQVHTYFRIPVDFVSPLGPVLRAHSRVVPIVRFIACPHTGPICTAPINYTLYLIKPKDFQINPPRRPVSGGVVDHHCPQRMRVETPRALSKLPRATAPAQAHSCLEAQR